MALGAEKNTISFERYTLRVRTVPKDDEISLTVPRNSASAAFHYLGFSKKNFFFMRSRILKK